MKKILVLAFLAAFVSSAFAVESKVTDNVNVKLEGEFRVRGQMFLNGSLTKDNKRTESNFSQKVRLQATINVGDEVKIVLRTTPIDYLLGRNVKTETAAAALSSQGYRSRSVELDRAYIVYTFNNVELSLGRLESNDYYVNTFGTLHLSPTAGFGDGVDGIKVAYNFDADNNVFVVYQKNYESAYGRNGAYNIGFRADTPVNQDADSYVLGTSLAFGDFKVIPSLGYQTDHRKHKYSRTTANLGAAYDGEKVESAFVFAFAHKKEKVKENTNSTNYNKKNSTAYGVYLDGAYKFDYKDAKLGMLFAIGSKDFYYGADFKKTLIVDREYFFHTGPIGVFTLQGFGSMNVVEDLDLKATVAYYKSILKDKKYRGLAAGDGGEALAFIGKKSSVIEFDLEAIYQLTASTTLSLAAGYAINNDVYTDTKKDANTQKIGDVAALRWTLLTKF